MGLLSKIFSNTRKPDELNKHLTAAGFREITIKRDERF